MLFTLLECWGVGRVRCLYPPGLQASGSLWFQQQQRLDLLNCVLMAAAATPVHGEFKELFFPTTPPKPMAF